MRKTGKFNHDLSRDTTFLISPCNIAKLIGVRFSAAAEGWLVELDVGSG
jgi:hypothetical protein